MFFSKPGIERSVRRQLKSTIKLLRVYLFKMLRYQKKDIVMIELLDQYLKIRDVFLTILLVIFPHQAGIFINLILK